MTQYRCGAATTWVVNGGHVCPTQTQLLSFRNNDSVNRRLKLLPVVLTFRNNDSVNRRLKLLPLVNSSLLLL